MHTCIYCKLAIDQSSSSTGKFIISIIINYCQLKKKKLLNFFQTILPITGIAPQRDVRDPTVKPSSSFLNPSYNLIKLCKKKNIVFTLTQKTDDDEKSLHDCQIGTLFLFLISPSIELAR